MGMFLIGAVLVIGGVLYGSRTGRPAPPTPPPTAGPDPGTAEARGAAPVVATEPLWVSDGADGVEFPACHVHQQDWGIPVRVTAGGAGELALYLFGRGAAADVVVDGDPDDVATIEKVLPSR